MKFHGLLLVRDEDDIVEETVRHALTWIDSLWVLDTGSTDATYDILEGLAKEDTRLRLLGSHDLIFNESLRAFVFEEARSYFGDGDWIIKLDCDEIYHLPPPTFVKNFASRSDGVIDLRWYYFRLTKEEVHAYESGEVDIEVDRRRSIGERRRFYKIPSHSEPRLFRYRRSMRFHQDNNSPYFSGVRCPFRIPVRHYPHRDPLQMEKRFRLRSSMKQVGSKSSRHWDSNNWKDELISAEGKGSNSHSALAREAGHDDDVLRYWASGEELPNIIERENRESIYVSALKRTFYSGPVRLADRFRPGFSDTDFLVRHRRAQGKT